MVAQRPATAAVDAKLRLFISYSRRDVEFADRLAAALEARGFQVFIDRRNLTDLEDWRRELLDFIRAADTVIFIISPRSIASPVCTWEIEQVAAFNKRLAPIVLEPVQHDRIPALVTKINYLFFDPPNDWNVQIDRLVAALNRDANWLREHSRLSALALHWRESGEPTSQLLRREEIKAAQEWIARRSSSAPAPPEILFRFLKASTEHEDANERRILRSAYVRPVEKAVADRRYDYALRLCAAVAVRGNSCNFSDANALYTLAKEAVTNNTVETILFGSTQRVTCADISDDGSLVVTGSADGSLRFYKRTTGGEIRDHIAFQHPIRSCQISRDHYWVLVWLDDGSVHFHQINHKRIGAKRTTRVGIGAVAPSLLYDLGVICFVGHSAYELVDLHSNEPRGPTIAFEPKCIGYRVVEEVGAIYSAHNDGTVAVRDLVTGNVLRSARMHSVGSLDSAVFSPDGTLVYITQFSPSFGAPPEVSGIFDTKVGRAIDGWAMRRGLGRVASFDSSGMRIAIAQDNCAAVYHIIDGAPSDLPVEQRDFALVGHVSSINEIVFSQDGKLVVTPRPMGL